MKKLLVLLLIIIFMNGCSTQKFKVGYDEEYDFSSLSTFAVVYNKTNNSNDAAKVKISRMLNNYMKSIGYRNVYKKDADFHVVVDYDTQNKGLAKQRIMLRVFDTKKNKMIWEASAVDREFNSFSAEQKNIYIKDVLQKLFRGFASK